MIFDIKLTKPSEASRSKARQGISTANVKLRQAKQSKAKPTFSKASFELLHAHLASPCQFKTGKHTQAKPSQPKQSKAKPGKDLAEQTSSHSKPT